MFDKIVLNRIKRWKNKAIHRRLENKKLKKRIKELQESRDSWKAKAKKSDTEIKKLKKNVSEEIAKDEYRPKGYWYSVKIITMLLKEKLDTSISFRAMSKVLKITKLYYNIVSSVPSHSTIISWVHKVGYYHLMKNKEIANDWIIILDHSIQIGQDKVFVILGLRESKIDFTKSLQYQDLLPLRIESRKKWDGVMISDYLKELKKEIGNIKYAVGDYGSDIKKGLSIEGIKHIHDITHAIALILKKLYCKSEEYLEFTKKMAIMRNKFLMRL